MEMKKAIRWVVFWVSLSLLFNLGIYFWKGPEKALEYLGGYLIEWSLSLDNLFLFLSVFVAFGVEGHAQRKVLNYGIAGAVILRLMFILAGVTLINRFHSILYVFGVILIVTGLKMAFGKAEEIRVEDSRIMKAVRRLFPMTETYFGERFFVKNGGKWMITPLFAVVILIELTDLLFAIDSIPAIFAISTDPLIVYTSNIFAILGLRSLFFVLGSLYRRFSLLKYGIAGLLVFTGSKLGLLFFDIEISGGLSVSVIFAILLISIGASQLAARRDPAGLPEGKPEPGEKAD